MPENANPPHPQSNPKATEELADDGLWLVSYADDDDREMTARQIAAALDRGEIDSNTIVWRDGMPEWKPIAEAEVLKAQLRRCNLSPETLRKRQTVLGGFGPVRQEGLSGSSAASSSAESDDDEPTVVQPMFDSLPHEDSAGRTHSDAARRHATSGNTLRIRTGEPPPVAPKTSTSLDASSPTPALMPAETDMDDSELDSLPSNMLVTAPNYTEVEASGAVRRSAAPPPPTRGVMTRHSDPPGTGGVVSSIPRATLTRDEDSAPHIADDVAALRRAELPKPPVPKRVTLLGDGATASTRAPGSAFGSPHEDNGGMSGPVSSDTPTPRATALPSSVRSNTPDGESESLANQRTRPPRSRRNQKERPLEEHVTSPRDARLQSSTDAEAPKSNGVVLALLGMGAAAAVAFALGKNYGAAPSEPSAPAYSNTTSAVDESLPTAATSAAQEIEQEGVADEPVNDPNSDVHTQVSPAPSPQPPGAKPAPDPDPDPASPVISEQQRPSVGKAAEPADRVSVTQPSPHSRAATPVAPAVAATAEPATEPDKQESGVATRSVVSSVSSGTEQPSGEVEAFNASAAASALGDAATRASACRRPGDPSGVARVTVTFANSGKATRAIVDGPPFAGTATGGCIAETMRNATVPAFSGERVTVKKTVVIQ